MTFFLKTAAARQLQNGLRILLVVILGGVCSCSASHGEMPIKEGATLATIVLSNEADDAEKKAASVLKDYLDEITGASFSIANAGTDFSGGRIFVGRIDRFSAALGGAAPSEVGAEGILLRRKGSDLFLLGGSSRASLYAVFEFLENQLGCKWWTPDVRHIPKQADISIGPLNVAYTPPFPYREIYTTDATGDNYAFATASRLNGHHQRQPNEWGGHFQLLGFVHTFGKLLPVEHYFDAHPEWYSDPDNGYKPATSSSKKHGNQEVDLCLGCPEVLEAVVESALKWIRKNPDAGYISISQNDHRNSYCRDDYATELIEKEGSASAPVLDFVNKVAARIHEHYPNFIVETLAYYYSEEPPKTIRPAKNVMIRLAPLDADFACPFDHERNETTRRRLVEWSKISEQLFVWHYITNFNLTMLPHPNWSSLQQDLQFMMQHNVKGVFLQGDNYTNNVGDFVQLRTWVMAKLLWDPSLDERALTETFLMGYYGEAGVILQAYLDTVQQAFLQSRIKLGAFQETWSFMPDETFAHCESLWQQALALTAKDETLFHRVERESISFRFAGIIRQRDEIWSLRKSNPTLADEQSQKVIAELEELAILAHSYGIDRFGELRTFDEGITDIKHDLRTN